MLLRLRKCRITEGKPLLADWNWREAMQNSWAIERWEITKAWWNANCLVRIVTSYYHEYKFPSQVIVVEH